MASATAHSPLGSTSWLPQVILYSGGHSWALPPCLSSGLRDFGRIAGRDLPAFRAESGGTRDRWEARAPAFISFGGAAAAMSPRPSAVPTPSLVTSGQRRRRPKAVSA